MASTKQEQGSQALLNTVQACFGQHLDEQVVRTVFEADQSKDFLLVSDVLWELLPEVSHPAQLKPVADWDVCVKERLVSLVGAVEFLLDPRQHCTTTTAARRQLRDVPTSCNAVVVSTQAQCASCRFDAFTTARYSLSKHNCRRLPVVWMFLHQNCWQSAAVMLMLLASPHTQMQLIFHHNYHLLFMSLTHSWIMACQEGAAGLTDCPVGASILHVLQLVTACPLPRTHSTAHQILC